MVIGDGISFSSTMAVFSAGKELSTKPRTRMDKTRKHQLRFVLCHCAFAANLSVPTFPNRPDRAVQRSLAASVGRQQGQPQFVQQAQNLRARVVSLPTMTCANDADWLACLEAYCYSYYQDLQCINTFGYDKQVVTYC